jgi:hypothetical protein
MLVAAGVGTFLDGIFRLDCQGIDSACENDSWHSSAHKIESGVTVGATLPIFSAWGDGAATRAGSVVVYLWIAFVGIRLVQKSALSSDNGS